MNKKMFWIFTIVLLVVSGLFLALKYENDSETCKNCVMLGEDLISAVINNEKMISSPRAVIIGPRLQEVLKNQKTNFMLGYSLKTYSGDLPKPEGDGKAKYRLVISTQKRKTILRLRPHSFGKFDVLGYICE